MSKVLRDHLIVDGGEVDTSVGAIVNVRFVNTRIPNCGARVVSIDDNGNLNIVYVDGVFKDLRGLIRR